jgi:hypothetical protein
MGGAGQCKGAKGASGMICGGLMVGEGVGGGGGHGTQASC